MNMPAKEASEELRSLREDVARLQEEKGQLSETAEDKGRKQRRPTEK